MHVVSISKKMFSKQCLAYFIFIFNNWTKGQYLLESVSFGKEVILSEVSYGCPSWKHNNVSVDKIFRLTAEKVGLYECDDPNPAMSHPSIIYFGLGGEFEFKQKVVRSKLFFGDPEPVECGVDIYVGDIEIVHTMLIGDISPKRNVYLNETFVTVNESFTVKVGGSVHLAFVGHFRLQCVWIASASINNVEYRQEMKKDFYVDVFDKPRVRPNKLVSYSPSEIFLCMSWATPPCHFHEWTCTAHKDKWASEHSVLVILEKMEMNCVCKAKNTIDGETFEGTWSGKLKMTAPNETKEISRAVMNPGTHVMIVSIFHIHLIDLF